MSPQRFAKVAVMCGTVVLAAWCGGRLGVGPALVETTAAVPVEVRPAALLTAEPERAEAARPMGNLTAINADVAAGAEPEAGGGAPPTAGPGGATAQGTKAAP